MKNNPLFDRLFGKDGLHPFGNPFRFEEYMRETFDSFENLKEKVIDVVEGEFKTTITLKLNAKGFPVSYQLETELLPKTETLEELKLKLDEAIKSEDYSKAADIQKTIRSLSK